MSIYNMLFGRNALAPMVLDALGLSEDRVPRFRDAYFEAETDRLVIHTRTGGGNRAFYENESRCRDEYPEYFRGEESPPAGPWNSDLRAVPGFLYDADDDFDCTYADWFYAVPEAFRPIFEELKRLGAGQDERPAERWQSVLAAMKAGDSTPDTARALAVGQQILGTITSALSASSPSAASASALPPDDQENLPRTLDNERD